MASSPRTGPTEERRYPTGKYRFDSPDGEFGVTYLSDDSLAVFAETYGDIGVLDHSEGDRMLLRISCCVR